MYETFTVVSFVVMETWNVLATRSKYQHLVIGRNISLMVRLVTRNSHMPELQHVKKLSRVHLFFCDVTYVHWTKYSYLKRWYLSVLKTKWTMLDFVVCCLTKDCFFLPVFAWLLCVIQSVFGASPLYHASFNFVLSLILVLQLSK